MSMLYTRPPRSQIGVAVSLLMLAQTARAELPTEDANGLQEVVVTATKRETNLQQTAVALSAYGAADLEAIHANSLAGLSAVTPGLYVGGANGFGATTMAIRGLGSLNLSIGGDEAVGVYVDGVYQGTPYGNQFDFVDVDQVQVLRGPQGTLYGRNATGGAFVVTTVTPGPSPIFKGDIGASQYSGFEASALASGPLIDGALYGKIAAGGATRDGYSTNPYTGEQYNGTSHNQVSGALRIFTNGVWDVTARAYHGASNDSTAAKNALDGLPINDIPANFPNRETREFYGATVNMTATAEHAIFTSISGYTNAKTMELTSSATDGLTQWLENNGAHQWYEELRLASRDQGRLTWMIGASYFRSHAWDRVAYVLTPLALPAVLPDGFGYTFHNDLTAKSYSGFAEVGFAITDRLHATAGARYTHDAKDWDNCVVVGGYNNIYTNLNPNICEGKYNPESKGWSAVTPHYVLDYRFTDDVFGYASFTKGFRSGGWSFTSAVNPSQPYSTSFDPEYASSYEVGVKTEWLEHRLRLNADAFLADYTDLQVRTLDPIYHLLETRNAGTARTKGVEGQLLARPVSPLTVTANLSWQEAKYTRFSYLQADGSLANYTGRYMDNAPAWQAAVAVEYAIPISNSGILSPRIESNYTSTVYYTETNQLPFGASGHDIINLRLRYAATSGRWSGELYAENLTSRQYATYAYGGFNNSIVAQLISAPRIIGARFNWRFE